MAPNPVPMTAVPTPKVAPPTASVAAETPTSPQVSEAHLVRSPG